jgi:prepilin-type processing-associated H-X9-DG protein
MNVLCPDCGRELAVPKPSLFLEDEWFPFKPELTVTSGKAIASLVPFNMSVPLTGLGSVHSKNGFNALFADGHVGFVKNTVSPSALDAILTRNGIQINEPDSY